MPFSNIDSDHYSDIDLEIFGNKIIILKRIKSLRQLRRTEKELVRLNYKEAIIKGFTLKGIQQYIASKTKIWIEWSCLEYLKKAEEQENREWYYHMARDHFAYVGAYRKCIDEIEQLKKEMWKIIMDTKAEVYSRVQASRELHNYSKTSVLLLRDLPFVANLSKFYDEDTLNSNHDNTIQSKNGYSARNNQEIFKSSIQKNFKNSENLDTTFEFNGINGGKTLADESRLKTENKSQSKYKNLDDEIIENMQRQMHIKDPFKGKSIDEVTEDDLDRLITPEHRESIRKIEELLDD